MRELAAPDQAADSAASSLEASALPHFPSDSDLPALLPAVPASRKTIRVAFVGQAGASAGGAERTLATHLAHAASDLVPLVILFEEGSFAEEMRKLGLPVTIVPAPAAMAKSRRERLQFAAIFQAIGHARQLARQFRVFGVDVVYSNTMKANFVCSLAARLAGIPCVMHFHDIVDGLMLRALRLAARFGSVERVACAHVVASSLGLKNTTVSYGPIALEAYRTLPNREEARRRLGLPTDIPVVAIIGRINRWKGHDRFLRIAALVNRVKPVHFAIVGAPVFRDADFVPELEALVEKLDLKQRVSFLPWVEDTRSVYAAIDLNVNCSTREPFGRSVVEASAAGVPSVFFDDSGAAETIFNRTTGRVVPAGDEAAFARAILDLLPLSSDPDMRALIRLSAKRFDARIIAEEIAAVVRRAAGSAASRSAVKPLGSSTR